MISSRNLYNVKFNGIELESKLLKSTSDREIASSLNFINLGIDLQKHSIFNNSGFHGPRLLPVRDHVNSIKDGSFVKNKCCSCKKLYFQSRINKTKKFQTAESERRKFSLALSTNFFSVGVPQLRQLPIKCQKFGESLCDGIRPAKTIPRPAVGC